MELRSGKDHFITKDGYIIPYKNVSFIDLDQYAVTMVCSNAIKISDIFEFATSYLSYLNRNNQN
jgi:hypothetical protein